jgi:hypothetical protein
MKSILVFNKNLILGERLIYELETISCMKAHSITTAFHREIIMRRINNVYTVYIYNSADLQNDSLSLG